MALAIDFKAAFPSRPLAGKKYGDFYNRTRRDKIELTTKGSRAKSEALAIKEIGVRDISTKYDTISCRESAAGNVLACKANSSIEARNLWKVVVALRATPMIDLAEDMFIARVTDWLTLREFARVGSTFEFAVNDCAQIVDGKYDDLADEKISTYVLLLGLTRSLRENFSSSWSSLYRGAYHVLTAAQGEEAAKQIMGRLS